MRSLLFCALVSLAACDGVFGLTRDPPVPDAPPLPDAPPVLPDALSTAGLVAYFPMDLATADGTPDVARGHATSCRGTCPEVTPGVVGTALRFVNHGEINLAPTPDLDGVEAFSVTAWLNIETSPTPATGPLCIASKLLGAASRNTWQVCVDSSRHANFYSDKNGVFDFTFHPRVLDLGAWFHVAIVWDGTTKSIYVDGVVGGAEASSMTMSMDGIVIGGDFDAVAKSHFPGSIDELRIYDRALTGAEIAAIAAAR